MHKSLFLCFLTILLASCSFFHIHKVEVEQGNVMTSAMVNRLHPGMTKDQTINIMGEPELKNIMAPHQQSYVYTTQLGSNTRLEKKVILTFRNNTLQSIQKQGI